MLPTPEQAPPQPSTRSLIEGRAASARVCHESQERACRRHAGARRGCGRGLFHQNGGASGDGHRVDEADDVLVVQAAQDSRFRLQTVTVRLAYGDLEHQFKPN